MPGHSYKGSNPGPANESLWAGPLAASSVTGIVGWTPQSGNPYQWQLWTSASGSPPFTLATTVAGNVNSKSGLFSNHYYYVQGIKYDGSQQNNPSNTVKCK